MGRIHDHPQNLFEGSRHSEIQALSSVWPAELLDDVFVRRLGNSNAMLVFY